MDMNFLEAYVTSSIKHGWIEVLFWSLYILLFFQILSTVFVGGFANSISLAIILWGMYFTQIYEINR